MAQTNGNGDRPSPISKQVHWKLLYRNPEGNGNGNGNGNRPPVSTPRLTQKLIERKSLILEREGRS